MTLTSECGFFEGRDAWKKDWHQQEVKHCQKPGSEFVMLKLSDENFVLPCQRQPDNPVTILELSDLEIVPSLQFYVEKRVSPAGRHCVGESGA